MQFSAFYGRADLLFVAVSTNFAVPLDWPMATTLQFLRGALCPKLSDLIEYTQRALYPGVREIRKHVLPDFPCEIVVEVHIGKKQ
jgi:hypothetical protein